MAMHGVVEGSETDIGTQAAALAESEDEILYVDAEDGIDDEEYDELATCVSFYITGELDDDSLQQARELADDGIAAVSDQHDEFLDADPDAYVQSYLQDELDTAEEKERAEQLRDAITAEDELAIVIHRDPDPDAISSAYAMQQLAEDHNVAADIYHTGDITRPQNKALVNELDIDMAEETPDAAAYDSIALLDTGITNSGLADLDRYDGENGVETLDVDIDIVVDHHPSWNGNEAYVDKFFDVRTERGSTASMVADYLKFLDITPDEAVATALTHGIRSDTENHNPEKGSREDLAADNYLADYRDDNVLSEIMQPSKTQEAFEVLSQAIDNREIDGTTLISYVENVSEQGAVPNAADELSKMEGVKTTVIAGYKPDDGIYISARSTDNTIDIGNEMHRLIEDNPDLEDISGEGGGDKNRAGGYLPVFPAPNDPDDPKHEDIRADLEAIFADLGNGG